MSAMYDKLLEAAREMGRQDGLAILEHIATEFGPVDFYATVWGAEYNSINSGYWLDASFDTDRFIDVKKRIEALASRDREARDNPEYIDELIYAYEEGLSKALEESLSFVSGFISDAVDYIFKCQDGKKAAERLARLLDMGVRLAFDISIAPDENDPGFVRVSVSVDEPFSRRTYAWLDKEAVPIIEVILRYLTKI